MGPDGTRLELVGLDEQVDGDKWPSGSLSTERRRAPHPRADPLLVPLTHLERPLDYALTHPSLRPTPSPVVATVQGLTPPPSPASITYFLLRASFQQSFRATLDHKIELRTNKPQQRVQGGGWGAVWGVRLGCNH